MSKDFKFKIDKQSDEEVFADIKQFRKEVYEWREDALMVYRKWTEYIDGERTREICDHFDCDLSDFREWLEQKRRTDNGGSE